MAGRRQRLDVEPAGFQRAGDDLDPELALVGDVIGMRRGSAERGAVRRSSARAASTSGSIGAPESTKTAVPPSLSATR